MFSIVNRWRLNLLLLISIVLVIYFAIDVLYLSDNQLYFATLANKYGFDRIQQLFEDSRRWKFTGYVFVPLIVLIRILFSSFCIFTGYYLSEERIKFKEILKICILSDFVFALAAFVKFVTLVLFVRVETLDDLLFQPLSLLHLFQRSTLNPLFIYPLSLLSVFEVLYILVIAYFIANLNNHSITKSINKISQYYGTGILIWALFIFLINLSMS